MRRALPAVLALVLAGCGGGAATPTAPPPSRFAGAAVSPPKAAPPIDLRDQQGRRVRLADLRGRFVLVTFLYTHCPDVCPLIASSLNTALRELGPRRDDVRVLAVSVDPKGDTPASVRRFARSHALLPQFRYLTGTTPQLTRVWRAYNVLAVARRADVVDHVAYTVLVDRSGRRRVLYDARVRASQIVHDVRYLLRVKSSTG